MPQITKPPIPSFFSRKLGIEGPFGLPAFGARSTHRQGDVHGGQLLGFLLQRVDPHFALLPAARGRRPVPLEEALPPLVGVVVRRPSPTAPGGLGGRYLTERRNNNKQKKNKEVERRQQWTDYNDDERVCLDSRALRGMRLHPMTLSLVMKLHTAGLFFTILVTHSEAKH